MRILVVTATVGRGGVALVVRKLLQSFADHAPADWHWHILGQAFAEDSSPVIYPAAWEFEQIDPGPILPPHPHQFPFLWTSMRDFVLHLERVASGYDIILNLSPFWIMRSVPWRITPPMVTYIPDFAFDTTNTMGHTLTHHFRDAVCKIQQRAAMTVFTAETHRQHAISRYQFDPAKTIVLPWGADVVADDFHPTPEEAARVRAKYDLPERYMLAFHPLYHKRPLDILKGMHIARNRSCDVPPLVMAGIDTDLLLHDREADDHIEEVRLMIRAAGLKHGTDLFVLGKIPDADIGGLYAGATASISASISEGQLSATTLQSFLARTPHIFSALPVYAEFIDDRCGYPFEPRNFMALAERILEVSQNPEPAAWRAAKAFEFAQSRTMRDVVGEYAQVFEGVMSRV